MQEKFCGALKIPRCLPSNTSVMLYPDGSVRFNCVSENVTFMGPPVWAVYRNATAILPDGKTGFVHTDKPFFCYKEKPIV